MIDEKLFDEKMNRALTALIDRGLITRLKDSSLVTLTENGLRWFAASGLHCLDEKKRYRDAAEMKTAMTFLTILSTGNAEENLLIDMGYIFEAIVDEAIPDFREAIEKVDFSQEDLCQPEKPVL